MVRVSRRVGYSHFVRRLSRRRRRSSARRARRSITPPEGGYLSGGRLPRGPNRCGPAAGHKERSHGTPKNATQPHWLQSLPSQRFQALFNSLFKVLCIFPSRYLFAIGLSPIFSFRRNLPPALSCSPKQLDSSKEHRTCGRAGQRRVCHPLWTPCSKGVGPLRALVELL